MQSKRAMLAFNGADGSLSSMQSARCPSHPDATLTPDYIRASDRFWGAGEGTFTYGRCPECGAWVLDPRPEPHEIGPWYARYYPEAEVEWRRKAWRKHKPPQALGIDWVRAKDTLYRLKRAGSEVTADTKVFDAGCGAAAFLTAVREISQAQVQGLDFDARCAAFAGEVYGVPVDVGELPEQGYADGAFDVVTTWHCLEHTYDPAAELAELHRITAPGGHMVLEVPTWGPVGWIFRSNWLFLQAPTHLIHFRPKTLRPLVEGAGWRIQEFKRPWLPAEIAGSLMLTLGMKAFVPAVMFPEKKSASVYFWRILFGLLMVIDLPLTFLLAVFGGAGGIRVVAHKPVDAPATDPRPQPDPGTA